MRVYLLYYDADTGDRESWNVFYTPVEVFTDPVTRSAREQVLLANDPDLKFHHEDMLITTDPNAPIP